MRKQIKISCPFIALLFFFLMMLSISCKKENPVSPVIPPVSAKKDSITISAKTATLRSISIEIINTNYNSKSHIQLFRQLNGLGTKIIDYPIEQKDTIFYDDNNGSGLLIDTLYRYFAVRVDSLGAAKDTSNTISIRTLGTTTHNYAWQTITMGEWQSALYDVWGTDENNVWAVGQITLDGKYYGALHYDGTNWVPDSSVGGYAIYGFSANDIWVVGGGVYHYDGNSWKRIDAVTVNYQDIILDTILYKNRAYSCLWGTSSTNLYFGSQRGRIVHWDGTKASLLPIYSEDGIVAMSGSDENNIYAVGWNYDRDIILHYQNGLWSKEYLTQPAQKYAPQSVYSLNLKENYICGSGVEFGYLGHWGKTAIPVNAYLAKIGGNGANNVFTTGVYSMVLHFNGINWHVYNELYTSDGGGLDGIFCTSSKVFLVGQTANNQAKIIIGTKQ